MKAYSYEQLWFKLLVGKGWLGVPMTFRTLTFKFPPTRNPALNATGWWVSPISGAMMLQHSQTPSSSGFDNS